MTDTPTAERNTATATTIPNPASRKIIPLARREARNATPPPAPCDDSAHDVSSPPPPPLSADALVAGWERVRSRLKGGIAGNAWRHWLGRLDIDTKHSTGAVIILTTPSTLVASRVAGRYADRLRATCRLEWPGMHSMEIRAERNAGHADTPSLPDGTASHAPGGVAHAGSTALNDFGTRLHSRMTFGNFVTDSSNRVAFQVAEETAASATPKYNPLFLHGGVGHGKTHLMQAIAAEIRAAHDSRHAVYMTAEDFARRFIMACRSRDTMRFKENIRAADVLLVDDIQFMGGKEKVSEEFLHTFNALHSAGKQIVVAGDRAPAELDGFDEKLRTRLNQGMVAAIGPSSHALRLEIITRADRADNLGLGPAVMEFLARRITASPRELEGALNRIRVHRQLAGAATDTGNATGNDNGVMDMEMDMETVRRILADVIAVSGRQVSIAEIKREVARHYNIRVADILSKRRPRNIVLPRQIAMYLAKTLTSASYPEIGRNFGGRDHTTVMYGVSRIENRMGRDEDFRQEVMALSAMFANGDCAAARHSGMD